MTPAEVAGLPVAAAPAATRRMVPERHPAVRALDEAASAADLAAVLELIGWTSDARVETRLRRLDPADWVFGRPNASVVMAAFLHGGLEGNRFSSPALGAWYGSSALRTATLEAVNGLRREVAASAMTAKVEEYREYVARLEGDFVDVRGGHPELHHPDPARYPAPQAFGETVRAGARAGVAYDSVRDPGGANWVAYRPRLVLDVQAAGFFRATVRLTGKVVVERLA
jgi:hypothetical protein